MLLTNTSLNVVSRQHQTRISTSLWIMSGSYPIYKLNLQVIYDIQLFQEYNVRKY